MLSLAILRPLQTIIVPPHPIPLPRPIVMATTTAKPTRSTQEIIDSFWQANLAPAKVTTKAPTVLPSNVFAQKIEKSMPKGDVGGRRIGESYEQAVKDCETKVAVIVSECRRNNQKYTDPHFDLDDNDYCLNSLSATSATTQTREDNAQESSITYKVTQEATSAGGPIFWGNVQPDQSQGDAPSKRVPACAKRVGDIFDKPVFYADRDAHVKDIRQGAEGDCWFISSLGCLCVDKQFPRLIEKICPAKARDEQVGVYGFVFFRDGEWISEIIDDKLYLSAPDYDDCDDERRSVWDRSHSRLDPEVSREEYRKTFQSNSDALFFGSAAHPNETWVPLIEKAFAKAHGDFNAIDGGWPGEGVEDLTGGVTTQIVSADILDKDQLWTQGFMKVNEEFLFSAGTREYDHPDPDELGRQGIEDGHAYSLLRAVEYNGNRLCLVKNPWGETEWNGPWSDGSKEWTAEALTALDHKFGNEGIFWMPYADFLRRYVQIWRTRLFTDDWQVSQHWTTVQVPWSGDYNNTKFEFDLPQATRAVIILSQLDARYFVSLTGQYTFQLAFRLHKAGEETYIVRGYSSGDRSATTEVDLEAGTYEVLLQISGQRYLSLPKVEDIVQQNWLARREKLMSIGLSYDLAIAKGRGDAEDTKADSKNETAPSVKQALLDVVQPSTLPTDKPESHAGLGSVYGGDEAAAGDAADTPAPAAKASEVPWDATCVVGLRVFCPGSAATIRVVKAEAKAITMGTKVQLDVDDPEKDATEHVG